MSATVKQPIKPIVPQAYTNEQRAVFELESIIRDHVAKAEQHEHLASEAKRLFQYDVEKENADRAAIFRTIVKAMRAGVNSLAAKPVQGK